MRVAVIGAGGWGTALALLLTSGGHQVRLWVRRASLCQQIQRARENVVYLPGVRLPEQLVLTSSLAQATADAALVVFAVPSHGMRAIAAEIASLLQGRPLFVSATKGVEEGSF